MKRMNKWIFMIGATCMLSSCGIYSTYKPQTSVPENLYGEEFLAGDTVSLGNLEWRELFKDPQLFDRKRIAEQYGFADSTTPG